MSSFGHGHSAANSICSERVFCVSPSAAAAAVVVVGYAGPPMLVIGTDRHSSAFGAAAAAAAASGAKNRWSMVADQANVVRKYNIILHKSVIEISYSVRNYARSWSFY